ncbi:MAG TPA: phosphoribosyltransferase family protein [Rhodocyclaceae bacterium]|jgi:uncharacterized HAD superfamily protein|nr:phosphoribosyltransferase family protein [Rhodocyclaceae bacterium]
MSAIHYRSFSHLSDDIKRGLGKLQAGHFDLVVGIPRSGMVPAYIIGLYLNLGVTSLQGLIANESVKSGSTRKARVDPGSTHNAQRILLVDDSISSGESLRKTLDKIPAELRSRITTLAIYSSKPERSDVDLFLEYIPEPRVFEWNVFHRSLLGRACVDIDGVLCRDPTAAENDDGERYVEFLLNADPLILPSYKIHSLVTNRLSKYRAHTEAWLARHGVEYDNLIMVDLPSAAERQRLGVHSTHKAKYYRDSGLDFFIESDCKQAREIAKITQKSVYCVETTQVYTHSMLSGATDSDARLALSKTKSRLAALLPGPARTFVRLLLGRN